MTANGGEGWSLETKRGGGVKACLARGSADGGKCRLVGDDNDAFWVRGGGRRLSSS